MLAPLLSRRLTTSEWPSSAAQYRAVVPSWYQYDYWIIMINIVSQSTALYYAANKGHLEVVSLLLDRGANIEAKEKHVS